MGNKPAIYGDVDLNDDSVPAIVRYLACLERSVRLANHALVILDEEGEPTGATTAALEAAQASMVAAARAELMDPWWSERSPPPDELDFCNTPGEIIAGYLNAAQQASSEDT